MAADYLPILIFLVVALLLSGVMVFIPAIFAAYRPNRDKLAAYECGFEAFDWNKNTFDIRFYLVAMLFIIFDLEIAFLFPWALVLKSIGFFGFASMMIFLFVLIIGFIYEWRKGALEWH